MHPHTSAGRVPTDSGLRLFVDGIMQAAAPNLSERREIERQIVRAQPIEDALAAASAALSGLSQAAGIVLSPKRELRLKQLNFVQLGPTRALAVIVGADGTVENRVVSLDAGTTAHALDEVSNFINARLGGLTLAEADLLGSAQRSESARSWSTPPQPSSSRRASRSGGRTMHAGQC